MQSDAAERNSADRRKSSTGPSPAVESLRYRVADGVPTGNKVTRLESQIPEFPGTDKDNIHVWLNRVEKVARMHGASEGVVLLVASSRLVRFARTSYDTQVGDAVESWESLKREMEKLFDRKMPYYVAVQEVVGEQGDIPSVCHRETGFDL